MVTTAHPDVARTPSRARAAAALGYATGCYLSFVAVSVYAVAFLADAVVPRTVDHGGPRLGTAADVALDAALLSLFAVQHSVMARPAFKRLWTRVVPPHLERATYVLASSAALALLFCLWCPVPTVVWDVRSSAARVLVWTLFAAGWGWAVAMTFAIDHLDMLGLRQVSRRLRGHADRPPAFAHPLPYRLVRHPLMVGFFVAFLAAPRMTVGHLVFAGLGCAYILVGVRLEEHDLTRAMPEYAAYAAATPRFVPRVTRRG
jgi:protein-S-isoprenylcysteine O-methyltransferase Ste14